MIVQCLNSVPAKSYINFLWFAQRYSNKYSIFRHSVVVLFICYHILWRIFNRIKAFSCVCLFFVCSLFFFNSIVPLCREGPAPWPLWLSWLGIVLQTKGSPVGFPAKAHSWVTHLSPPLPLYKKQPIDISLPLVFPSLRHSLPQSLLKKRKIYVLYNIFVYI